MCLVGRVYEETFSLLHVVAFVISQEHLSTLIWCKSLQTKEIIMILVRHKSLNLDWANVKDNSL